MDLMDLHEEARVIAFTCLYKTHALEKCHFHSDVDIRVLDEGAERHAYALATLESKKETNSCSQEDVVEAVHEILAGVAEGECSQCARAREA